MWGSGPRRKTAGIWLSCIVIGVLNVGLPGRACRADESPLGSLLKATETQPQEYSPEHAANVAKAAGELEEWFAGQAWALEQTPPTRIVAAIGELIAVKQQVDRRLAEILEHRRALAEMTDVARRHTAVRHYLTTVSALVDLSGRLRYTLRDAIDTATFVLDVDLERFAELVDLLRTEREEVGALALAYVLFNPPEDSGASPYPDEMKRAVLELIDASANLELVAPLADYLRSQPNEPAPLVLRAAEVLWTLGLPQRPRPGAERVMPPAMTATELIAVLRRIRQEELSAAERARCATLLVRLNERERVGVTEPQLALGRMRLQPGDWLLMRNPSPYNHFTDLGAGLFTHVGLVAEEVGTDGVRRIVIVDLPERGATIPATNVERYLDQTLHYVFLRHTEPEVQRQMAAAAQSLIGNESQFDLLFDTSRVLALRGKPLDGQRIHTYCAGLLLICAQATGRPREDFFPIDEGPPGERCLENLALLGMSIGDSFVSPTGPLFSPDMELVGWREPMYDPGREVKESVYDHFAYRMIHDQLQPSPNAMQLLRERVAGLANRHEWLRLALARANDVSEHMDLESAARAAAVIETLDDIADRALHGFEQSRIAVMARSDAELLAIVAEPEQQKTLLELRRRHADLVGAWQQGRLTPRDLRLALVAYYRAAGCRELDERFFPYAEAEPGGGTSATP